MAKMTHATAQAANGLRILRTGWIRVTQTIGRIASYSLLALTLLLLPALGANPAMAADEVCAGENLMERMALDAPDDLARIREDANRVPNGKGLLWRIERDDVAPSWLYGTMHVADPRVLALSDAARASFDKADTVVLESGETTDLEASADELFLQLMADPKLSMLPAGTTLSSFMDEHDLRQVETALEDWGVPPVLMSRMQPWLLADMISMTECELEREIAGDPFLDLKLAEDAIADGKTVTGLETFLEQAMISASVPLDTQITMLIESAETQGMMPDLMATMTELYVSGEIGMIEPVLIYLVEDAGHSFDRSALAEYQKLLVAARNQTMAERAQPLLEQGSAFIAVGALHLPGEEGLVELLRDRGYRVTAVDEGM